MVLLFQKVLNGLNIICFVLSLIKEIGGNTQSILNGLFLYLDHVRNVLKIADFLVVLNI